jgi:hypothetical protein
MSENYGTYIRAQHRHKDDTCDTCETKSGRGRVLVRPKSERRNRKGEIANENLPSCAIT